MSVLVRIWDVPTRLFHWSLVVLFCAMWFTGTQGGEWLQYHIWAGYGIASLVLFRLIWGLLGSQTSRFAFFIRGPRAIIGYLRGTLSEERVPGHNPLGALMVLLMLALLAAQITLGFFAADVDSYSYDGPLAHLIDSDLAESITGWHKLLFNVLLGAVGLHLCAIAFYALVKKRNLVRPMLTGDQRFEREVGKLEFIPTVIAMVTLVVSAGAIYTLVTRL